MVLGKAGDCVMLSHQLFHISPSASGDNIIKVRRGRHEDTKLKHEKVEKMT